MLPGRLGVQISQPSPLRVREGQRVSFECTASDPSANVYWQQPPSRRAPEGSAVIGVGVLHSHCKGPFTPSVSGASALPLARSLQIKYILVVLFVYTKRQRPRQRSRQWYRSLQNRIVTYFQANSLRVATGFSCFLSMLCYFLINK